MTFSEARSRLNANAYPLGLLIVSGLLISVGMLVGGMAPLSTGHFLIVLSNFLAYLAGKEEIKRLPLPTEKGNIAE